MKNLRLFVLLVLSIAAPLATRYRAWSLGAPVAKPVPAVKAMPSARLPEAKQLAQAPRPQEASTLTADVSGVYLDLPAASSSLPLLSVIGFGVFIGGLISALRTRPAHK